MKPRRSRRQEPPPAPAPAPSPLEQADAIYRAALAALREAEQAQAPLMGKVKRDERLTPAEDAELTWRCSVTEEARGRVALAHRALRELVTRQG